MGGPKVIDETTYAGNPGRGKNFDVSNDLHDIKISIQMRTTADRFEVDCSWHATKWNMRLSIQRAA
jgi:hypothetical protein